MPVNAFAASAASTLANGDSPEHVRETLGLSETELAEARQHTELPAPPKRARRTAPVGTATGSVSMASGLSGLSGPLLAGRVQRRREIPRCWVTAGPVGIDGR
jgi:hypothetical protein